MDPLTALLDQSSMSADKVESLARIQGYRQRLNAAAARANRAASAACHSRSLGMHGVLDRQYRAEVRGSTRCPARAVAGPGDAEGAGARGAELHRDIARSWARSSLLMQQMLAPRGARYVHVLQPNQYFTTRPFAPGEAAVALAADSLFKPGVEQGYPALQAVIASGALATAGVTVVDGVHLFDAERAPVYIDNCCHYTRRGYEILADAIAAALVGPGPVKAA